MDDSIAQFALIGAAGVAAPILAEMVKRFSVPGVVLEILVGVLIGPQVFHWLNPSGAAGEFGNIGLALLMFLAGFELDLRLMRGRPLRLAGTTWFVSVVLAVCAGVVVIVVDRSFGEATVLGLAMTTTALGTLLPVVADSGLLAGPFGRHVLALGSLGEFGPIVLIALLLGGTDPARTLLLLVGFGLLAVLFAMAAHRSWGIQITGVLRRGLHSSSQLPVRVSFLLLIGLDLLAANLGLDVLLGAFAAGVIVRIAVSGKDAAEDTEVFRHKLEAIGFGLFIPAFFVVSGARLDLGVFGHHPWALCYVPVFFAMLLIVRGLPTYFGYRRDLPRRERAALAVFASTGLPLIVVITTIAVDKGYLYAQGAAAMVLTGMLSVLLLPAIGLRLLGVQGSDEHTIDVTGGEGLGVPTDLIEPPGPTAETDRVS